MLTVIAAAAPSLALLIYFYLRDRYEREPVRWLLLAYLLGMFAMLAAQHGAQSLADAVPATWQQGHGTLPRLFDAFVLSGLVEEVSKWTILIAAVYHWREFDEPFDGLVYGVAIALGFASLENYLYLTVRGLEIAWLRAVFAVPAHALFGGTMGFYVGRAKFPRRPRTTFFDHVAALVLPVVFHGSYNFALANGLNWHVWVSITVLSLGLWLFVLGRLKKAQHLSPYRPKTMLPGELRAPDPSSRLR
jgi:RsiW-degrading membrane proteinase PrsW (M82 family)